MLIFSKNALTDTPEMMFPSYVGIPDPRPHKMSRTSSDEPFLTPLLHGS